MRGYGTPLVSLSDYQENEVNRYRDDFERSALEPVTRRTSATVALEVNPEWASLPPSSDYILSVSVTINRNTRVAQKGVTHRQEYCERRNH